MSRCATAAMDLHMRMCMQVDEATAAGVAFLDGIKKDFVERMKQ